MNFPNIKGWLQQRRNWQMLYFLLLIFAVCRIGITTALFTDSVDNTNNILSTAKLDITTSSATEIFNVSNLVPGDTVTRTIDVQNVGTVTFTYKITAASSTNTLLWTNKVNGLQLEIKQGATVYYNGPISDLNTNAGADMTLGSSSSHTLTFTISFPITADNSYQQLNETISFTFSATQLPGVAR